MMKTYQFSSADNKTFRVFQDLLTSKGIKKHGQALIYGQKVVAETLRQHSQNCLGIISTQAPDTALQVPTWYQMDPSLFSEIDPFGIKEPILLVKVPEIQNQLSDTQAPVLYLPFQEPSNVGSVLRSAAAFGVRDIILGETCAHPFLPKSSRAASGSLFSFRFLSSTALKQSQLPVVALDKGGHSLNDFKFPSNFILAPGVEGPGIQRFLEPDFVVGIPIENRVESLNVNAATSIVLFSWRQFAANS